MANTAPPGDNLFVGDLPEWVTKEQFEAMMGSYGTVVSCRVMPPKVPGSKGSGLVRFSSVEEATWVVENLNGNIAEGLEEPVVVRFANAPGAKGDAKGWAKGGGKSFGKAPMKGAPALMGAGAWGGAKGCTGGTPQVGDNLFVGDLPAQITQELFEQIFAQYGTVVSCKVLQPKVPGAKASGLVRFSSVEEAQWVVDNLNGNLAEGLQEPVKVRFANAPGSGGAAGKGAGAGAWGAAPMMRAAPYAAKGAAKGGKGGSMYFLYGAIKKSGLLGPLEHVPETNQVFVKNLPPDTTDLDLFRIFAPFGAISATGVKAMLNEDGSCKGFGFIDFSEETSAIEACNTLNGFQMPDGSWLGVSQKSAKAAAGAGKAAGKGKGGK